MSVKLFYDPDRVEEFRARGIDPRRTGASPPGASRPGASQIVPAAKPALAYVEENARLRAEVARLRTDNQRLAAEVVRLSGIAARRADPTPSSTSMPTSLREDDAVARFGELDF